MVERRLLTLDDETVEITHEALLREWPRLAGWLSDDVDSRRLHHHLTTAAALWAHGGGDDGDLLRGVRLAATNEWCSAGHGSDLNDAERRFVVASVALADRELDAARIEARHQSQVNRRLRVRLVGIAVLFVGATVAGVLAVRQAHRADRAAATATDASLLADAERLGAEAGLERDLDASLLLAAQAFSMADTPSTRGGLVRAVQQSPEAVRVIRSDGSRMLALELSPDGTTLAVNEALGGTTLYDASTGERIGHYQGINALTALAWTPDGSAFATVNAGGSPDDPAVDVVVVDAATLNERARYTGRRDPAADLAFSPDGRVLVAAPADTPDGRTPQLTVWDVAHPGGPRRMIDVPDATDRDIDAISFDASGDQIAVSIVGATAIIDLRTGERTATFDGSGGLFSPDGRTLAVGSGDEPVPVSLVLVDVATGDRRSLQGAHSSGLRHRDFSRDGSMIATSGDDSLLRVWDTTSGRELYTLAGHTGRVRGGAFSPDGATIYSTGLDRTIITWDLGGRNTIGRMIAPPPDVTDFFSESFAVTSDHSIAVAAPFRTTLLVPVDMASGTRRDPIDTGHVTNALIPGGGTTVIAGADDGALYRWDVATGSLLAEAQPHEDTYLYPLAISSDHSTIYVQTRPSTIQPFDAATLDELAEPLDIGADIAAAAAAPDGESIAVATVDPYAVRILDLQTDAQRSVTVPGYVTALAFSPDGSLLSAGDADGRVLVINTANATLTGDPPIVHDGPVTNVTYSPDGTQFTSDSTDGIVMMWETATGRTIGPVHPGPSKLVRSTWATDGHTLLVMYSTSAIYAFDTRPSSWLDYACRTAGRQLTESEWTGLLPDRPFEPACN